MKSPQTRAIRLVMRRIMAAYTNASPLVRPPQQRLDAHLVHNLGAVDVRLEHEAFGVHQ